MYTKHFVFLKCKTESVIERVFGCGSGLVQEPVDDTDRRLDMPDWA